MSNQPPLTFCGHCGSDMVISVHFFVLGLDEPLPAIQCFECGTVFVDAPADALECIRQALRDQVRDA